MNYLNFESGVKKSKMANNYEFRLFSSNKSPSTNQLVVQMFILVLIFLKPSLSFCIESDHQIHPNELTEFIDEHVRDKFPYSGFANFYNSINYYLVEANKIEKIPPNQPITMVGSQWLAVVGHYKVLTFQQPKLSLTHDGKAIAITNTPSGVNPVPLDVYLRNKSDLKKISPELDQIRYAYLWKPLQLLSRFIDFVLVTIYQKLPFGWGLSILLFSILFKVCTLPVNMLLNSTQRKVSYIQALIEPELDKIKASYHGKEAHEKFMEVHKKHGISPFYTLKPLLFTLVPIPFLIAIFNALGEMDPIAGHSFLWIDNLAHPDAIFHFKFHIPLIGNQINLLPILMTIFNLVAVFFHRNIVATKKKPKKTKNESLFHGIDIFNFILPFPFFNGSLLDKC